MSNPQYSPEKFTAHPRLSRNHYQAGRFFITICTQGKYPWFGQIRHGIMGLSDCGSIIADEWTKTPRIRSYVELDAWIVMPNHIHGIITLNECESGMRCVDNTYGALIPPTPGSLSMIINQFKTICTKRIRGIGVTDFAWQPRFYDDIIRDERELQNIRRYILNNPAAWTAGRS